MDETFNQIMQQNMPTNQHKLAVGNRVGNETMNHHVHFSHF
jgi:hypothetical protein